MSIVDPRAELDYGATPGVPMSILSKTNRRVIGRGNIEPPIPTTLPNVATTWASLLHAVTEDKNAEQITISISVQKLPLPPPVLGFNGLTARIQWGVDGGFHEAFCDVGAGTTITVQAASVKVDIQNSILNRTTNPPTFLNATPRVVSSSLGIGEPGNGPYGGPKLTYFFSAPGAGALIDSEIPPFAYALAILPVLPGAGSVRFLNDDSGAEIGRYTLAATQQAQVFPIPGIARFLRFSFTVAPINVAVVWYLKL